MGHQFETSALNCVYFQDRYHIFLLFIIIIIIFLGRASFSVYGGQKQKEQKRGNLMHQLKDGKWRKRVINLQQGFCSGQRELNLAQAGENSCSVIVITSDCHTFNFH